MIIQPLDTIFSACTSAITTEPFDYRSAKLWDLNLNDEPPHPEVLWALPFTNIDKFLPPYGLKQTRMIVQLFFLKSNQLYERQPTRTILVDAMHDAFKLWAAAFEASSISPTINEYRIQDVYDEFDVNRSGISVVIDFTFMNTIC